MRKLSGTKCRLKLVISSKWHIVEMFKVEIHVRNDSADASKTISHDKMLPYRFLIDITMNNYNPTTTQSEDGCMYGCKYIALPHVARDVTPLGSLCVLCVYSVRTVFHSQSLRVARPPLSALGQLLPAPRSTR